MVLRREDEDIQEEEAEEAKEEMFRTQQDRAQRQCVATLRKSFIHSWNTERF